MGAWRPVKRLLQKFNSGLIAARIMTVGSMEGRIIYFLSPTNVHILLPKFCEYGTVNGKKNFVDAIMAVNLEMYCPDGASYITSP